MKEMITLYQFSYSHFCEKVRWALDYKSLEYNRKNLLAGPHRLVTRKLAAKSSVPILVDGKNTVQDSTAIIDFLDEKYPERMLTPEDQSLVREVRDWEEYLDEELGVTLRAWFYYHTLPDENSALTFLLHEAPCYGRLFYPLIFPRVRAAMQEMMAINANTAMQSEQRFLAALDRISKVIDDQPFLVGDRFTRADLTACALLKDFILPNDKFKNVFPPAVTQLAKQYVDLPVGCWVKGMYQEYRYRKALS